MQMDPRLSWCLLRRSFNANPAFLQLALATFGNLADEHLTGARDRAAKTEISFSQTRCRCAKSNYTPGTQCRQGLTHFIVTQRIGHCPSQYIGRMSGANHNQHIDHASKGNNGNNYIQGAPQQRLQWPLHYYPTFCDPGHKGPVLDSITLGLIPHYLFAYNQFLQRAKSCTIK